MTARKNPRVARQSAHSKASTCCGCGVCVAICPFNLVALKTSEKPGPYFPREKINNCIGCGQCEVVCPTDRYCSEKEITCSKGTPQFLLGKHLICLLSHCADPKIRLNSSSGGTTTSILMFMLQAKLIDGALVTRMKKGSPFEPESFVATSATDLLSSSGSIYCLAPIDSGLRYILENEGKYAVVGLPCQIRALRKAAAANKKIESRIICYIGLFCSHSVSPQATEFFLKRAHLSKNDVREISYRGKRWPTGMTVTTSNGCQKFFPSSLYWTCYFKHFFIPLGCISCDDETSEGADISIGDAWLPELKMERMGTNVVVIRTEKGRCLVKDAKNSGYLKIAGISDDKVIESQRASLRLKKTYKESRFLARKIITHQDCAYSDELDYTFLVNPMAWVVIASLIISYFTNSELRWLLKNIPEKLLRSYAQSLDLILKLI